MRRDSSGKFVAIQVMEKLKGSRLGGTDLSTQLPAPRGAEARVLKVEDQPRHLKETLSRSLRIWSSGSICHM